MAAFSFQLYEGLNAISIPLQLTPAAAKWTSILSSVAFNSIKTVVNGQWQDYIRGRVSTLNDFDSAVFTQGYLIDVVRVGTTPTITGILPATCGLANLDVGSNPYVSGTEVIQSIPLRNQSSLWLQTVPADASNSSASYITFTTDRTIDVYVAYDSVGTAPSWLTDWENTQQQIVVSSLAYNVYRNTFNSGLVTLPGNHDGGGTGTAMYLVLINENLFPIFVSSPSSYQVAQLQEGFEYYLDNSAVIINIPEAIDIGLNWIRLNQAEYTNNSDLYLSFTMPGVLSTNYDGEADVYVAYDATVEQPPAWLNTFDNLNITITTTIGTYNVFKQYSPGGMTSVVLGGASAPTPPNPATPMIPGPDATPSLNYLVAIYPTNKPSVTVTVSGTEPSGINDLPLVGSTKGGLNFIGFPKSATATDFTIATNINLQIPAYTQLLRMNQGVWESYVPTRDASLNWFPPVLDRGLGYLLIMSAANDQVLEIDYNG